MERRAQPAGTLRHLSLGAGDEGGRGAPPVRRQVPGPDVGGGRHRDRRHASRVPRQHRGDPRTGLAAQASAPGDSRVKATYDFTRLRKLHHPRQPPEHRPVGARSGRGSRGGGSAVQGDAAAAAVRAGRSTGRCSSRCSAIRHEAGRLPAADPRPRHARRRHPRRRLARDGDREATASGHLPRHQPLRPARARRATASGDEFAIIAALQFIRYLNAHARPAWSIHGVNLSLSIRTTSPTTPAAARRSARSASGWSPAAWWWWPPPATAAIERC